METYAKKTLYVNNLSEGATIWQGEIPTKLWVDQKTAY